MAPSHYSSESGFDSDDDAPEAISTSTAKQQITKAEQANLERERSDAQARKAKNKAKDKRLKAAKGKARAAAVIEPEEDEEPSEDEAEETMTSQEPIASSSKSKKINFLDPAVFEDAATYFQPEKQPAAGQGKMAAKKQARAEKRAKREAAEERATRIGTGGARQVDGVTLQHLPAPSHKSASLATTAHPSATSATKFLDSRLYSKKRKVAVLDAGKPRPTSETSGKKKKKTKGMSLESRILQSLGMDDGARDEDGQKERERKRKLLLQAEGKRKPVTLARPLASARTKSLPASNFAVSQSG